MIRKYDLVMTDDGYYAIVTYVHTLVPDVIDIFVGNGLRMTVPLSSLKPVGITEGSPASANFAELFR